MKIYILDRQRKSREQILNWLAEDQRVEALETFEDYISFIEQVAKSPPDFCFVRLGNNGIPGLKAADMVKQTSPEIRIVFVSDDRDYALDAYEIGAYGYLLCPVNRKQFEKCLEKRKSDDSS